MTEQEIIDQLVGKDMRFTRIHEYIKMRVPISTSDRDYYLSKFDHSQKKEEV